MAVRDVERLRLPDEIDLALRSGISRATSCASRSSRSATGRSRRAARRPRGRGASRARGSSGYAPWLHVRCAAAPVGGAVCPLPTRSYSEMTCAPSSSAVAAISRLEQHDDRRRERAVDDAHLRERREIPDEHVPRDLPQHGRGHRADQRVPHREPSDRHHEVDRRQHEDLAGDARADRAARPRRRRATSSRPRNSMSLGADRLQAARHERDDEEPDAEQHDVAVRAAARRRGSGGAAR